MKKLEIVSLFFNVMLLIIIVLIYNYLERKESLLLYKNENLGKKLEAYKKIFQIKYFSIPIPKSLRGNTIYYNFFLEGDDREVNRLTQGSVDKRLDLLELALGRSSKATEFIFGTFPYEGSSNSSIVRFPKEDLIITIRFFNEERLKKDGINTFILGEIVYFSNKLKCKQIKKSLFLKLTN